MNFRSKYAVRTLCVAAAGVLCVWATLAEAGKQAEPAAKQTAAPAAEKPEAAPADPAAPAADGAKPKSLLDGDTSDKFDAGTAQDRQDLINIEKGKRDIRGQWLKQDVTQKLESVRGIVNDDPTAALKELKRTLNSVTASTDIDANTREQLRARVQQRIDQVASRKDQIDQDKTRAAERRAQEEARRHLVDQLVQRDEKLEQLIDRVRSLLTEGYQGNADAFEEAEAVARVAWELNPYSGTTAAAIFDSEAAGQLDKSQRLRSLRADMFLATLHQVELAHVPFPDEPPILWPSAEVWQALTERRKKWASVDLVRYNKIEERIRKSLDLPTDVEFIETPLDEAINFLKEQHNINIVLDKQKIADEGVATDTPITLQLSGISLRSVLKLMLEQYQLTYVIDNEVMKITTSVAAGEKLYTRVYPVGDLVIPVNSGMMGGMMGGMGGGMMGMMGNGMGGMGGGMMGGMGGGMGGGMMGGMGGMGGMGMMSVTDDAPAAQFNNSTVRERKKKLTSPE